MPNRVFLSHRGADKPRVRRYCRALKAAGYRPWLDEEELHAGVNVDRAIRDAFKDAQAVIFFVTPDFRDERFLKDEINYAKEEERAKDGRFLIITVVLSGNGSSGEPAIPDLLRPYLWIQDQDDLSTLTQILEALASRPGALDTGQASIPVLLHHMSFAVSNLDRSVAFYRDVLGLRMNPDRPAYLFPGAWFTLQSGQELHLVLNEHGTFRQSDDTTQLYLDNHLALRVPDIVAFENRMLELGYGPEITKDKTLPTRYPQRYFLDPDRHVIEVNADGFPRAE